MIETIEIDLPQTKNSKAYRPINYLGSKLQLVNEIAEIAKKYAVTDHFCDLFSGSGVVSHHLSTLFKVQAIDIQYYSFILSSSLIGIEQISDKQISKFFDEFQTSLLRKELRGMCEALISFEEDLLSKGLKEEVDRLSFSKFHDNCSIYRYLNSNKKNRILIENELIGIKEFEKRYKREKKSTTNNLYCTRYFGGVYFSFTQAIEIDIILSQIEDLKKSKSKFHIFFLSALMSTVSEVASTVGKQFAQPMKLLDRNGKPKNLLFNRTLRDRSYNIREIFLKKMIKLKNANRFNIENAVHKIDYRDFLKKTKDKLGFIYADPPYTIDHYSRFYHVLETISLKDNPKLASMNKKDLGNVIMKGLYREKRHQSPFCIPSKVNEAFKELFEGCSRHSCPLLLSYSPFEISKDNRPRLLSIDEIIKKGLEYYENAKKINIKKHKHRKLNKAERNIKVEDTGEIMLLFY